MNGSLLNIHRNLVSLAGSALLIAGGFVVCAASDRPAPGKLDYDRDVRPILSENCFKCHGFDPVARKAGLRLDYAEGAYAKLANGSIAIVPGNWSSSALFARVSNKSMPPLDSGKKLTTAQVTTLNTWIQQGAKYGKHWAFVTPTRPPLPGPTTQRPNDPTTKKPSTITSTSTIWDWCRNPIDNFILKRLLKDGLKPSPKPANRPLIHPVPRNF